MGQKAQCCNLPSVVLSSVYGPITVIKIIKYHEVENEEYENYMKHLKDLIIQITFSSTKEKIEGLGCIARNCAFFDISTPLSESFVFLLVVSGKQVRKEAYQDERSL